MGIKDRDYWQDPSGDWNPDEPARSEHRPRKPWTLPRILAWATLGLLILGIVLLAVTKPS